MSLFLQSKKYFWGVIIINYDRLKNIISNKSHGNSDISQKYYQLFYFERISKNITKEKSY